jgi:hypothetical protein
MTPKLFGLVAFMLCISGLGVSSDHYRSQTMIGILGMLILLGAFIWSRVHWSVALTFLFAASSAAFCAFSPTSPFIQYGTVGVTMFEASTAKALVFLVAATLPIVFCSEYYLDFWVQGFGWLGFASSVEMIFKYAFGGPVVGVLDNPALDATFLALLYPLMALRPTVDLFEGSLSKVKEMPTSFAFTASMVVCPPVAIILSKSNSGLAVLVCELLLYVFLTCGFTKKTLVAGLIGCACTYGVAINYFGQKFMNDDGRYHVWKMALAQWLDMGHYVLGAGTGTFSIFGPAVQKANGYTQFFLWAHNDWLQVLFEQGVLGLVLTALVFVCMLSGSLKTRGYWLFVTVIGLGLAAVTQMPLRIFPLAVFSALVCRLSFLRVTHE